MPSPHYDGKLQLVPSYIGLMSFNYLLRYWVSQWYSKPDQHMLWSSYVSTQLDLFIVTMLITIPHYVIQWECLFHNHLTYYYINVIFASCYVIAML